MCLLPGHRDLVPVLALGAGDDADRLLLVLQDRALLDMGFEIGADIPAADRGGAVVADALEFVAEQVAGDVVGPGEHLLFAEHAGKGAGAHHRRREAAALLVGPGDDLDRRVGLDLQVVEGADDLQPGEHPVGAVELAACRLGIEMAAGHHRRARVVLARAAGEDVADAVDAHRAAGGLAPADEQVAALPVEVGEREPTHAALLGRADLRQLHQGLPQSVAVYRQVLHVRNPRNVAAPVAAIAPSRARPQPASCALRFGGCPGASLQAGFCPTENPPSSPRPTEGRAGVRGHRCRLSGRP